MTAESTDVHTSGKLLVIEGYDGSGKSTLIEALSARLSSRSIRVIGRKAEPELQGIAAILENDMKRPDPRAEILLRIAVEVERTKLVARALKSYDLVICDRGVTSLIAWFRYLDVEPEPFAPLIEELKRQYRSAVTIICQADFETCWSRSSSRAALSRKDRLGEEINRRYYADYDAALISHLESDASSIVIDTAALDVDSSAGQILRALELSPPPVDDTIGASTGALQRR